MAVTKSWERSANLLLAEAAPYSRRDEFVWLLGASLLVAWGLALVCAAKMLETPEKSAAVLNLNVATAPEQILPFLTVVRDSEQRRAAANQIFAYLEGHRPLPNVGALSRLRINDQRLPLPGLKPLMVVRTRLAFLVQYVFWCAVYLAAFWMVHVIWRRSRFRGDQAILPALQVLTGMGLILTVSLRDPLRDTLEFRKFAWGAALGCCLLLLPLLREFHYGRFARWTYTPLFAAFGLFALMLRFGTGPTGSDARVNLGPFQPVELIKFLLVLFLAGYFGRRWEWLRELNENRLLPRGFRWLKIPRASHALPVMTGVAGGLIIFFLLKDLGPALIAGLLFLIMFSIGRRRYGLALVGMAILIGGFSAGYHYGKPNTVVERVSMWLAPWDNDVRGGNQLAHSLWAFSTGGAWGSGPGWGDPEMIPAGHTDLVLPAIAEEWGFAGVLTVCLLYVFLIRRTFQIALHAPDEYAMFLTLGCGTLIGLEMLLISGGVLGAIPLSGVVSPFLSSGNTAMLSNFLVLAVVLGVSSHTHRNPEVAGLVLPFGKPMRILSLVFSSLALGLLTRAAYIQLLHDREFIIRDARVIEEDGVKRSQYNPRLRSLARAIPRGTIFDRNGLPLATSQWAELEKYRAQYDALGVSIEQSSSQIENRYYPFGAATVHLLGDLRTGENFHATNASLVEHDFNQRLQGYSDLHDLGPLVRYRHQPLNPEIRALLAKDRGVRTSIDIRLQTRVFELLRKRLEPDGKKGAVVVMDPENGDVLALASFPSVTPGTAGTPEELFDRARYGQYPPGSVFKLVTAIAALRLDPDLRNQRYQCLRLRDGRVGAVVKGWNRPIRDDAGDSAHGTLTMERALIVSCNAYFAQLGTYDVGASSLHETAGLLDLPAGEIPEIQNMMPFASYGQGPVLVTPFKMARVAATIAAGGVMPQGHWILGDSDPRNAAPRQILSPELTNFLGKAMRSVVTEGTGRRPMQGLDISVAGKTGTAQVEQGPPHSWFVGFAPADAEARKKIAFAVVGEHGGYGSQFAARLSREIVEAARDLGIIERNH